MWISSLVLRAQEKYLYWQTHAHTHLEWRLTFPNTPRSFGLPWTRAPPQECLDCHRTGLEWTSPSTEVEELCSGSEFKNSKWKINIAYTLLYSAKSTNILQAGKTGLCFSLLKFLYTRGVFWIYQCFSKWGAGTKRVFRRVWGKGRIIFIWNLIYSSCSSKICDCVCYCLNYMLSEDSLWRRLEGPWFEFWVLEL